MNRNLSIRPQSTQDLPLETIWRTDPDIAILNPPIPVDSYIEYYSIFLGTRHIGMTCLYNRNPIEAELGIIIGERDCWDKGYGTDAVLQVLKYCFEVLCLERVYLSVLPDNIRAVRCYIKCGFRQIGQMDAIGHTFDIMEVKNGNISGGGTNA